MRREYKENQWKKLAPGTCTGRRKRLPAGLLAVILLLALVLMGCAGTQPGADASSDESTGHLDAEPSNANDADAESEDASADVAVHSYENYEGSILPVIGLDLPDDVVMDRNLTLDFSPYEPHAVTSGDFSYETTESAVMVKDEALLTNHGSERQTLHLMYPTLVKMSQNEDHLPVIYINDEAVDASFFAGAYTGTNEMVPVNDEVEGILTENHVRSWLDLAEYLTPEYIQNAMTQTDLVSGKLIVYEYSDLAYLGQNDEGAILEVHYTLDPEKTVVLSQGFNQLSNDESGTSGTRGCHIPIEGTPDAGKTARLYVLGDDLLTCETSLVVHTYSEGEDGQVVVETSVPEGEARYKQERKESDLDVMVDQMLAEMDQSAEILMFDEGTIFAQLTQEQKRSAIIEGLMDTGALEGTDDDMGSLDGMSTQNYFYQPRLVFRAFDVDIDPGETVSVRAVYKKDASRNNYVGDQRQNHYDIVWQTDLSPTLVGKEIQLTASEGQEPIYLDACSFLEEDTPQYRLYSGQGNNYDFLSVLPKMYVTQNELNYWGMKEVPEEITVRGKTWQTIDCVRNALDCEDHRNDKVEYVRFMRDFQTGEWEYIYVSYGSYDARKDEEGYTVGQRGFSFSDIAIETHGPGMYSFSPSRYAAGLEDADADYYVVDLYEGGIWRDNSDGTFTNIYTGATETKEAILQRNYKEQE